MSAFVVHDLKNIVTQLSLMLKNAQRLRDNPEFQEDMLLTVESSLEKMRRMMLQLREGATPPGGARGVELAPSSPSCRTGRGRRGHARDPGRGLLATRGHEERLERVLGHLGAERAGRHPPRRQGMVEGRRASVDRCAWKWATPGQGMSEDFIRNRLFKPFSSTKHSGMGIGTYESAQYIRELGGSHRGGQRSWAAARC
jgi:C4-dicarboxylate-specific signal transduction histidine kinase